MSEILPPLKVLLIVGSTRPGRTSDLLMPWLEEIFDADSRFDLSVEDLRDWPLPMFQEEPAKIGNPASPNYSDSLVGQWNRAVTAADAYVFVTPEYNHSVPGVLKNAIDSVFFSPGFRNKPCAFVGYSISPTGAVRAIEHLIQIVSTLEAMPLRNAVMIGKVSEAFDEQGKPVDPMTQLVAQIMADDVHWWGNALRSARAQGQLPPAQLRIRQAIEGFQAGKAG
ncbi:MAG: NADPH-dependent FMN reductase [Congregibacter sp.]